MTEAGIWFADHESTCRFDRCIYWKPAGFTKPRQTGEKSYKDLQQGQWKYASVIINLNSL